MSAPTIVLTGQARAGIRLLHSMLSAGGIPDAPPLRLACEGAAPGPGLVVAPVPHANAYQRPRPCLGLFIGRSTAGILRSIERELRRTGRASMAAHEKRILTRQIGLEFGMARDAAARAFAPVVMFEFEDIIADPRHEALRLDRLVGAWWPEFDTRCAALSVRRIQHTAPVITLTPRLLSENTAAERPAS